MNHRADLRAPGALRALLLLDGTQFIEAAFQAILGRATDSDGLKHYSSQLMKNADKLSVLSDILSSAEASSQPHWAEIVEQVRRYKKRRFWRFWRKDEPSVSLPDLSELADLQRDLVVRQNEMAAEQVRFGQSIVNQLKLVSGNVQRLEYRFDCLEEGGSTERLGGRDDHFVMNLSTSNHWRSHAVGIVRVEREIARCLQGYSNVQFVLWDAASSTLRALSATHVRQILSEAWCEGGEALPSFDPAALSEISLTAQSTYISVGLDWDHAPTPNVLAYLRTFNSKSILCCYDLVPVLLPEFLVRETLGQEFRHHLLEMAHGATKVFVISEATKRELKKFWADAQLELEPPEIFVLPLVSYASSSSLPPLNAEDSARMRDVFRKGAYVLYVSSFEPRKNYKLALDVWRDLWNERGEKCPQFVHVGMSGWGSNDLLNRVPRMAAYIGGKINWLPRVSDNLLAHLYANCSFTIFPSIYEGWGLAATESLAFGKVCVVANNSSLEEATQGLTPAYHPLDFPKWKAEIEHLLDDDTYRSSLEKKITNKYKHRTWGDFAAMFSSNIVTGTQK